MIANHSGTTIAQLNCRLDAERALRLLVVLRKITFGSRTDTGATRMAKLMTVAETAHRHRKRTRDIYYELYTRPPDRVLTNLYASR